MPEEARQMFDRIAENFLASASDSDFSLRWSSAKTIHSLTVDAQTFNHGRRCRKDYEYCKTETRRVGKKTRGKCHSSSANNAVIIAGGLFESNGCDETLW